MKKLLFILTVVIAFTACSEDVQIDSIVGTISGSVADKTTGEPISVANIQLSPLSKATITGTDGTFEFSQIEEGTYTITVTKEGYNSSSKSVQVIADKAVECHLLMERIPAIVKADCDELDFGDKLTTLAFSIVNSGYETLEWSIEYDKKDTWISEVKPIAGELASGKTAAIVVSIDREKLRAGNNELVLVVVSTNGKHEIKAKAIGESKELPTLNMLSEIYVTSSTAIVNAEITHDGVPMYTERGFIYGTRSNPTFDNCTGIEKASNNGEKTFSCLLDNLELNQTYYVKAFARNSLGEAFSPNEIKITPTARHPKVVVNKPDNINVEGRTAKLHGEVTDVGDPQYTEKGFVFGFHSNPSLDDNSIMVGNTGDGKYYAQLSGLIRDKQYFVRGYIINDQGTYYSNNEETFTVTTTLPTVSIKAASNTDVTNKAITLNGYIDAEGVPAYYERGFVYGLSSNPTISDNRVVCDGKGVGEYSIKISNIEANKTYYVRAYAINEGGTAYSTTQETFLVSTQAASVTLQDVSNINVNTKSVVFNAEVTDVGAPAYTARGFVYNTSGNPSLADESIVVQGSGKGAYFAKVSDLQLNTQYYVRAYVTNEHGTTYSTTQESFSITTTAPVISIDSVTNCVYTTASALFQGSMSEVGNPKFTERGFVYGTVINPNIYNNKLIASSTGDTFSMSIAGLEVNTKYWIRCYAIQNGEVFYSSNERSFTIAATQPEVDTLDTSEINSTTMTASFYGKITDAGDPAFEECGFVYSNTNIYPTLSDTKLPISTNNNGYFETHNIGPFLYDQTYYLRAYATNAFGTSYGDVVDLKVVKSLPAVTTLKVTDVDFTNNIGVLHGEVTDVGVPAYSELGFVYSTTYEHPTINDNKFIVKNQGTGHYEYRVTELTSDKIYYVRAYATNDKGTVYGDTVKLFDDNIYYIPEAGIAVQLYDIGKGDWNSINSMCENSTYEGYADWRLPTLDELYVLYNNKELIGNFTEQPYWSSTEHYNVKYYLIYFSSGTYRSQDYDYSYHGRCVRTITKTDSE